MTPKQVFVREATGLVRELSTLDATIINVAIISIGIGITILYTWAPYLYPGMSVSLAVILGGLVSLIGGIVYGTLSSAMPRSGGDYVFVSRALTPSMGMVSSWFNMFWGVQGVAACATFGSWFIAVYVGMLGLMTKSSSLTQLGADISSPNGTFVISLIIIIISGLLVMSGVKRLARVQLVAFVIGMIGVVAAIVAVGLSSNGNFIAAFDRIFAKDYQSYAQVISASGFTPAFSIAATVMAIPCTLNWYTGFWVAGVVAGEIKKARTNVPIATGASILFTVLIWGLMAGLGDRVFGYDFVNAISYLYYAKPAGYLLPIQPLYNLFAMILNPNLGFVSVVGIGWIAWGFVIIPAFILMLTRILFAWSFDRVLPEKLSEVSKKYHSPIVATLVASIASVVFLWAYLYTGLFQFVLNFYFGAQIWWIILGVTALVFPFTMKRVFQSSPFAYRIGKVPIISIVGVLQIALSAYLLYQSLLVPAWQGPAGVVPISVMLVTGFIAPFVIFWISRYYRKKQGIEFDLIFKEIPPE